MDSRAASRNRNGGSDGTGSRRQGIFWLLTVPHPSFTPYLPPECSWIKGQLECAQGGFLHWQFVAAFSSKKSISGVRKCFGPFHAELTRSESAVDYVWKDDTRVEGTQFELGAKPFRRNSATDWESVWSSAVAGDLSRIPANVRVVSYRTIRAIAADYSVARPIVRTVNVFWGRTGTGKSRRAWEEGGMDSYAKDPRSKFWDGYQNEKNIIIDEFRGGIDIAHLLRWCDRYPVRVEIKGSSRPLAAEQIWITSNICPRAWYPDADGETLEALLRRLTVTQFT